MRVTEHPGLPPNPLVSAPGGASLLTPARPLTSKSFDDLRPRIQGSYLVKRLLPSGCLAVVYGPPKSGKSFFATDLSLHVAAGLRWRDRNVTRAPVLYVAAEGAQSIENRICAWRDTHGLRGLPWWMCGNRLALLDPGDAGRIIEHARHLEAEQGEPLGLTVIDTLARAFGPGDENSAADMGAFVGALDRIREAVGCAVLVVHHAGKETGRGARGSNSLLAAVDVEIAVENRVATVTNSRDGESGERFAFGLRVVEIGEDCDGEPVTTCVVEVAEGGASTNRAARLSPSQRITLGALHSILDDRTRWTLAGESERQAGARVGQPVVLLDEWRRETYGRDTRDRSQHAKKVAFGRDTDALQAAGLVAVHGDLVWLS